MSFLLATAAVLAGGVGVLLAWWGMYGPASTCLMVLVLIFFDTMTKGDFDD